MSQFWITDSDKSFEDFLKFTRALYEKERYIMWKWHTGKQRTEIQNNALHLYCQNLAVSLNDGGYDFMLVMNTDAEIPWSKVSAKEFLWRPIQKAITGKASTTRPTRAEYPQIYDALNSHLAIKYGISEPWPVKDRE